MLRFRVDQSLDKVIEVTNDQICALRPSFGFRLWIFYQRGSAAGPAAALDIGIDVAHEPRLSEIDVVFLRRFQNEEGLRLATQASVFRAVITVEEILDWRTVQLLHQALMHGVERGARR